MSSSLIESKLTTLGHLKLIGRAVKTTNEAEMKGEGVIPALWESFYNQNWLETTQNKKNKTVLAAYTDYESDENGSYSFVIGAEVMSSDAVPAEMNEFEIPENEYIVFTTRKGPIQEIVVEAWQYIWEWSKNNKRAFLTDFEVYDERCADPENSQVDIYISLKR
ncbi:GyrI-like domain-containing protein [Bacillus sp. CECT 9360]|uniref:GyrI-like domain-containing protein n=1 Tax=Bacillus sp. CECT 9360 TaxID=2845821 RepID=UPI001E621E24|nr:GyrI-like domain-containing protein [Bacillus sp. CECT 9360]CAH0344723.1 hypothetical protein BCI9360_00988 [Bacillus sp. CECT 9360]